VWKDLRCDAILCKIKRLEEDNKLILIASWARDQDFSVEDPRSVRWEDGSPATLNDYHEHLLDTQKVINEGDGDIELHMFPSIVAEVSFDTSVKAWVVTGRGVIPATLDVTDPQAKDDQIIADLSTFPIVYRAVIKR
jgi:hypothetical protein